MKEFGEKIKCKVLTKRGKVCSNDAVEGTNYCNIAPHKAQGIKKNKDWFSIFMDNSFVKFIVLIITVVCCMWDYSDHNDRIIHSTEGELTPDSKIISENACGKWGEGVIKKDDVFLFLGNSVAFTDKFPHTVIEIHGQPILILNKNKDSVTISGKFYSKDGKIVAELKNNKFFINPNNYFRLEKPNSHTLIVFNQEDEQVINVEFLNKNTIKLLGKIYYPNYLPIIINETSLEYNGTVISSSCVEGSKSDIGIQ